MRALGVPLSEVVLAEDRVRFALVGDQSSTNFEATLRDDSLAGKFSGGEGDGTFSAIRQPAPEVPYREEDAVFPNGSVQLAGTLLVPNESGRHPAVVFMHGSGPEARHGSRYLADYVARHHVAALIYDKRGVGSSTGDWRLASLQDLADDAIAAVRFLKQRPDIDTTAIGTYGHSQGGLITPLVATRSPDVAFVIAGATYGGVVYEQDLFRVERALGNSQFTAEEQREAMNHYRRFVDTIRTGVGMDEFERENARIAERPWIRWLAIPPRDHWLWKSYPAIGNFDPLPQWERVRIPTLLLYGQDDQIVPVDVSIQRIGRALNRAGNSRWAALILPRAAHNFTVTPRVGEPFEWRVVAPGLAEVVSGWIQMQVLSPPS
jgi:pimeloyl-ACP methyl ester carboxylesterase